MRESRLHGEGSQLVSAAKTQTEEVLKGLYKLATVVPGVLFLCVALMLIFVYPLTKKKVEENVEYLRAKRDGAK